MLLEIKNVFVYRKIHLMVKKDKVQEIAQIIFYKLKYFLFLTMME